MHAWLPLPFLQTFGIRAFHEGFFTWSSLFVSLIIQINFFFGLNPNYKLLSFINLLKVWKKKHFLQKLAHIDQRERERQEKQQEVAKNEEIVLLEKQGRCSQKMRNNTMGNLVQVSQSVGQNMTDISNIGVSSASKVIFFLRNFVRSNHRIWILMFRCRNWWQILRRTFYHHGRSVDHRFRQLQVPFQDLREASSLLERSNMIVWVILN